MAVSVVKEELLLDKSSNKCTFQIVWGVGMSRSEDRGGGDNSIEFINFVRVGDKGFKEWRQQMGRGGGGGMEGWVTTIFDFLSSFCSR